MSIPAAGACHELYLQSLAVLRPWGRRQRSGLLGREEFYWEEEKASPHSCPCFPME